MKKKYFVILPLFLIVACTQKNNRTDRKKSFQTNNSIPALRKNINKKPVAFYDVPMGDPRLDRRFGVAIFETSETFKFYLSMQYDAMFQSDTLQIPNFDVMPEVQIRPGPIKLSCIIGFLDKEKNFREYKLLSAKGDKLTLTTMKSYGVETYVK